MQTNIALLAKRAIGEALKGNWDTAIKINTEILEKSPNNIDAKLRLGRAYMQTKQFPKAKKMYKEVLQLDPINQVAHKNLESLNNKNLELNSHGVLNPGLLIKEPGTTAEINLEITGRGMTGASFASGEVLTLRIKKKSVDVFKLKNKKDVLVGTIKIPEIVNRLNKAIELKSAVTASVIKCMDKRIEILLKSTFPVFKSEKQDIRPYIKKGSLDEPDIEAEELELGS